MWGPPPPPVLVYPNGQELEPHELTLPGTNAWEHVGRRLSELSRADPERPPRKLLALFDVPLPELYAGD